MILYMAKPSILKAVNKRSMSPQRPVNSKKKNSYSFQHFSWNKLDSQRAQRATFVLKGTCAIKSQTNHLLLTSHLSNHLNLFKGLCSINYILINYLSIMIIVNSTLILELCHIAQLVRHWYLDLKDHGSNPAWNESFLISEIRNQTIICPKILLHN